MFVACLNLVRAGCGTLLLIIAGGTAGWASNSPPPEASFNSGFHQSILFGVDYSGSQAERIRLQATLQPSWLPENLDVVLMSYPIMHREEFRKKHQRMDIKIGSKAPAPKGWIDFCNVSPKNCAVSTPDSIALSSLDNLAMLNGVNQQVNQAILPLSDTDHWGVDEKWSYPVDGRGDCEDYAIMKLALLIEKGWPSDALLITVVRKRDGEEHAVLTARTDFGDLVLDNLRDELLFWNETGYRFVMRQAVGDQAQWVWLVDPAPIFSTFKYLAEAR